MGEKFETLEVVAICDHLVALRAAELECKIVENARSVIPTRSSVTVLASQGFRDGVVPFGFAKGFVCYSFF